MLLTTSASDSELYTIFVRPSHYEPVALFESWPDFNIEYFFSPEHARDFPLDFVCELTHYQKQEFLTNSRGRPSTFSLPPEYVTPYAPTTLLEYVVDLLLEQDGFMGGLQCCKSRQERCDTIIAINRLLFFLIAINRR